MTLEHQGRFPPGAFAPLPEVPLNLQHNRSMVLLGASEYALTDTECSLKVRVDFPADSAALRFVWRGPSTDSTWIFARAARCGIPVCVIDSA